MEWTVVGVIIVLVGLFFTVGKPIWSILKELQTLRCDTNYQERTINQDSENIRELSKIAQSHENRLQNIEGDYAEVRAQTSELLKVTQSHEARITGLEHDINHIKQEQEK